MEDDYELLKTAAALNAVENDDVNTLAELFVMELDNDTKVALANALVKEAEGEIGRDEKIPPWLGSGLRYERIKKILSGPAGWGGAAGLASIPGILALALALRRRGGAKGANKLVSMLRKVRPR